MKGVLNWMAVYYLLAAIIFVAIADSAKAYMHRLQRDETWAMHPVDHLLDQKVSPDSPYLRRGLRYYKTLLGLAPHLSQAHGIKGYCYYYLDKKERSIRAFLKAVDIEPRFYWHQYNLGLIYYERQDFDKAAEYFQHVAFMNSEELLRSSIYNPLARLDPGSRKALFALAQDFALELQRDARKHLVFCQLRAVGSRVPEAAGQTHLVIHPWVKYIPVGKEGFFASTGI